MPNPSAAHAAPIRLALLLYPGCMPAGLFAVADLLRAANQRAQRRLYEVVWAGVNTAPVPTWQGPALAPTVALEDAAADGVLVPGWWLSSASDLDPQLQQLAPLVQALRQLPAATQLWSYCAGVVPVAASGRLHGQAATATWWLREALQARFPRVDWRFDEAVVAGPGGLTAAGAHGYVPLVQQTLAAQLAPAELRDLQNLLMLPRPAVQHPSFAGLELTALADAGLRRAWVLVQRTAAADVRLQALAQALHLSHRTLARRVQAHTGLAAAQWVRRIKLRQVADALCETRQPLKRIAEDLGFASEASLIRSFRQATGMTPMAYRLAHA